MRKFVFTLCLILLAALAFAARCWNLREVFVEGRIYFVDGDCYSRMTRARLVSEGADWSIRHHDFENYPQGTAPHTTALLDWLIVGLAKIADWGLRMADPTGSSVLSRQSLDVAGAVIGPLLGALACLAIGALLPGRKGTVVAAMALLAVSPIAVHGTTLGRPDHQALLILLVAVALVAEWRLVLVETRLWAVVAGLAWGVALWVSLYEPLVLLAVTLVGLAAANRLALVSRLRWLEWGIAVGCWLISVVLDGWRVGWPAGVSRVDFARWSSTIFELNSLNPLSDALWQWLGPGAILVPVALGWQWRSRPEARLALVLLVAALGLTFWQLRWGYFLAVIFACCLPLAFDALLRRGIAWMIFAVSLWPVAKAWDTQLFPNEAEERRRFAAREEQVALRWIAEQQRELKAGPFLAPWWLSPALAYWSGQPAVAGTSHESLRGILDSARIFLAPDAGAAWPLIEQRGIAWIVADDPDRVIGNSATILGVPPPEHCLALELVTPALPAPYTLAMIPERQVKQPPGREFFHVWKVRLETAPAIVPAK